MDDKQIQLRLIERIKEARKEANLPTTQVDTLLGLPNNTWNRIENGTRRVQVMELVEFARAFNRPLKYFIDDEEQQLFPAKTYKFTVEFTVEANSEEAAREFLYNALRKILNPLIKMAKNQIRLRG